MQTIISIIVPLLSAVFIFATVKTKVDALMKEIEDVRKFLRDQNKENVNIVKYVSEELKQMNQQMLDREVTRNTVVKNNEVQIARLESDMENVKELCNIRHRY